MGRDMKAVLERWGEWAAGEDNRSDWPTTCAMLRGVIPGKRGRPSCSDDDGLCIDACVSCMKSVYRNDEREALYAYYVLGLPSRDAAQVLEIPTTTFRSRLMRAESFVEGCLHVKNVSLDMDLLVALPPPAGRMDTRNGMQNAA